MFGHAFSSKHGHAPIAQVARTGTGMLKASQRLQSVRCSPERAQPAGMLKPLIACTTTWMLSGSESAAFFRTRE